jgi:uncharacterized protein YdeI (BOF family)
MEEKTIYRISLALIAIGLVVLMLYAQEIDTQGIINYEDVKESTPIKLTGTITKLNAQNKILFLEVSGEQQIKTSVIIFEDEELYLQTGDYVEIEGYIEEYKNQPEIVANKITKK